MSHAQVFHYMNQLLADLAKENISCHFHFCAYS
jgi:hypothetical protein